MNGSPDFVPVFRGFREGKGGRRRGHRRPVFHHGFSSLTRRASLFAVLFILIDLFGLHLAPVRGQSGGSQLTVRSLLVEITTVDSLFSSEACTLTLKNTQGDEGDFYSQDFTVRKGPTRWNINLKSPLPFKSLNNLALHLDRPMAPHNLVFGKHEWTMLLKVTATLNNGSVVSAVWPEEKFHGHVHNSKDFFFYDADQVDESR